ncbi:MAG TPA: hypothetical protein VLC91_13935, partial [Spongiibacteraceae bacterium]|nr:hypothetical protein [Spongiibacteraceae bacterium]
MTRYLSSSLIGLLTVSCLNLWLAIVIASDAMFGGQTQTDMLEWNPGLPMPAERTNAEKPIDAYNQILVRPLFYKNREPFVPPPAPQPVSNINAPAAISDPGFVLAGVLITGETRKAYILTRANNSGTWARE